MLHIPVRRLGSLLLILFLLPWMHPAQAGVSALTDHITPPTLHALAGENAWWRLLHYKQRLRGIRSQVDEADFFLHPEGYRDPAAELHATLAALERAIAHEPALPAAQDVRCTYPARIAWLARRLALTVPPRPCPELEAWLADLDAGTLSLIFASAYMNSASSMFGHTLLRIDSANRARTPDLVAWAVNFAAQVDDGDGGLAYAIKGLAGRYPGYFSLMPYYEKVNEYNHLESRDLWEYPLRIEGEALQRVLWHLWELNRIRFDYWFFDENCSYQLLALLSVAEDHLDLTRGFEIKALPVDTVRALSEAGLLEDRGRFRPAFATRLQSMAGQLDPDATAVARRLAHTQADPLDPELPGDHNPAQIHELAFEWLNFRFRHQNLPREEAAPQLHRLLLARSRQPQGAGFQPPAAPAVAPHQGHDSARWGLGAGRHHDQGYLSLLARPSYHDLYDAVEGYLPGAEITLLEVELRYYTQREQVRPWQLTLFEVGNYLGSSPVFTLPSWRVGAALTRTLSRDDDSESWRARLGGGYGYARGDATDGMVYLLLHGELEAGPQAGEPDPNDNRDWAAGAGLNLGGLWSPVRPLRSGVDLHWIRFGEGNRGALKQARATLQWNYGKSHSLRLHGLWSERHVRDTQAGLTWLAYF